MTRGRILGRYWKKNLKSFPPCYLQSPLQTDLSPPPFPPPSKSGLNLVSNVNIVYGNLKSENSQDYAQKLYVHEFGFWCMVFRAAEPSKMFPFKQARIPNIINEQRFSDKMPAKNDLFHSCALTLIFYQSRFEYMAYCKDFYSLLSILYNASLWGIN